MKKTGTKLSRAPGGLLSTLRARLMALVLLASLPALTLIVYTNIEQRRHDNDEAVAEALSSVRHVADHQMDLVQETNTLLSVLEHTMDLDDGPAMSAVFAELVNEHALYSNIAFISPDGFLVASALPFKAPLYLGDRLYFKRAIESLKFSAGDYQVGRVTNIASINFGYPVIKKGALKGVLVAALPITALEKRLSALPLQQGQTVILSDSAGALLARHPSEKKWLGKNLHGTEHESILRQNMDEGYSRHKGLDGVTRIHAYTKLKLSENGSIYVISGIPYSVVYAKADHALLRNVLTSSAITVLVLLLAWFASDKLVLKGVRKLVSVTTELGAGKRKTRAAIDSGCEELNYLATSLNEMADALEAREEESERHLTRIARLNRIYAVLSGINSTIIRNIDRDELLKEACRIAVEHGHFVLAWIALSDDSGQLYPAAWAGSDKEYVDKLMEYMSPDAGTKPLALRAFLDNKEMISGDFEKDVKLAPWKELAAKYGYRSVAAFPLRVEDRPIGALSFYSVEVSFFDDEEELALLLELASDTSLGLEKIEKEKRIEYLSRYDILTGLANRWVFEDHLSQGLTRAKYNQRVIAVAMLDIENFSRINDTLGHKAGDDVLKTLAVYITGSIREGDTAARLGNDNFGIILQDLADRKDAVMVAEKITGGLPASVMAGGEEIFIKVYAGIAIYPDDGASAHELIKNTELAMHAADTSGAGAGSARYYSHEINLKAQERRAIENELRHALERKEFELAYQPIVNVEDRRITGVEALLRWKNEKLGPVSPDRFIPVAEETGLIIPIGEWVLKTAVAQAIEWERRGIRDMKIGVNVSVGQIRQADFCENLERILGYDFGSRAVRLAIEVTESELMKNMEIFINALNKMRSLGLTTYIDDFGTGYSSLSYLKELPIDTLKIDRSFIRDLATDSSSHSMAMGIIAIANSLGLDVVAEGVENEEQLAILSDLGCGSAQGFLFSRPVPAKSIEALLMDRH
ncbi:MAG: EAL domain-containing protein [Deltaproteobacteria bacterium]|nr:EAL domain-containing protein [Deltaproteobacteria bacterium]